MSIPAPVHSNAALDAFLDGSLSPRDHAAFEATLAHDPALADQVALQRDIDARLRALMQPPVVAAPGVPMTRGTARRVTPLPRWLRAAALIALAAVVGALIIARPWSWRRASDSPVDTLYSRLTGDGFTPAWVCTTNETMRGYTRQKLGFSFLVHPAPDVQLVGWTYSSGLLENAAQVLMARAAGTPVIVVMGPAADDRRLRVQPGSPLHIFPRQYRGLTMYEVSPLDHPTVLPGVADDPLP